MRVTNPQDQLISKLVLKNRLWSYDLSNGVAIPDDVLIEKTLIYLDIDDIHLLFELYPYKKIKQVWLERIAIQGDFFARLNKLLAWMFFGIKNPEKYLKRIENKHLKVYQ
jgi:hypothetical protein